MKRGIKHILVGLILLFLFLPLLQERFNLTEIRNLSGDFVPAKDTVITPHGWFTKKFQEKKEKFLQDNFGYHNIYVRIHNQIAFELFKKAKANGVVIGKENYLYEQKYIDTYYGSDYIGVDSIEKKMLMIDYLADTLKKLNKTFLLVFAPGKGAYFPEYIPENRKAIKGITNIEVYKRFAKELNVPHIDFHTWFIQNKGKTKYPLIPKYGIHWSQYGSVLATDSILKTIELMANINIPEMYWDSIVIEKAKNTDNDIESGMNLLNRFPAEQMAYPQVVWEFEPTEEKTKPSVLVVADSYYWQIFAMGISNVFDRSDFWYYFKAAHSPRFERSKTMDEVDIFEEMDNHNVIILMSTDIHLNDLGWNFVETMFKHYDGKLSNKFNFTEYHTRIEKTKNEIRGDLNWMNSINKKAAIKNITVDSMLYLDAKWVVDQQMKN